MNPNPFDVEVLNGGGVLVADAGANDILYVDNKGRIEWVATLPEALVSTANAKALFGCPAGPPDICGLPDMIPGQAVATSIAIGPDGTLYVTELDEASWAAVEILQTPTGGTINACEWGSFPFACDEVATGLMIPTATAIGNDGTLYTTIWSLVPGLADVVAVP